MAYDFYAEYARWYQDHYGEPYPITRAEWSSWCARPGLVLGTIRKDELQEDLERDVRTERAEGYAYG